MEGQKPSRMFFRKSSLEKITTIVLWLPSAPCKVAYAENLPMDHDKQQYCIKYQMSSNASKRLIIF